MKHRPTATRALIHLAWPVLIARLYTTDHQVQAAAIPLIALVGLYHPGDALQGVAVNALRGFKKSVVPMLIYAVMLWGVGLGAGVWLAAGLVAAYLNAVSRAKQLAPGNQEAAELK